jgi:hypothetical protein
VDVVVAAVQVRLPDGQFAVIADQPSFWPLITLLAAWGVAVYAACYLVDKLHTHLPRMVRRIFR